MKKIQNINQIKVYCNTIEYHTYALLASISCILLEWFYIKRHIDYLSIKPLWHKCINIQGDVQWFTISFQFPCLNENACFVSFIYRRGVIVIPANGYLETIFSELAVLKFWLKGKESKKKHFININKVVWIITCGHVVYIIYIIKL